MTVLKNVRLFYTLTQGCSIFQPLWSTFVEKFIAGHNRCRNLNLVLNFNVLFLLLWKYGMPVYFYFLFNLYIYPP